MQAQIIKISDVATLNAQTGKRHETQMADLLLTEPGLGFSQLVTVPAEILGNYQAGGKFRVHFEHVAEGAK